MDSAIGPKEEAPPQRNLRTDKETFIGGLLTGRQTDHREIWQWMGFDGRWVAQNQGCNLSTLLIYALVYTWFKMVDPIMNTVVKIR